VIFRRRLAAIVRVLLLGRRVEGVCGDVAGAARVLFLGRPDVARVGLLRRRFAAIRRILFIGRGRAAGSCGVAGKGGIVVH
jgi:hypothetical protein